MPSPKTFPEPVDANALLDALGIAVFSVDHKTGDLLSVNDACARMFGYDSPEQAVGGTVFDHYSDPEERREAVARFFGDPKVLERGWLRVEAQRCPRGSDVPISILMTILLRFDEDGEIIRLDCTAENIGERKQAEKAYQASEERFRIVFEESNVGMAIAEPGGRVNRVNKAFCRLIGRSEDELLNKDIRSLLHPEEDSTSLLDPSADRRASDRRFLHADGDVTWGYMSMSWLRDDEGEPHSAVFMVQDITARRRAEAALVRIERLECLGVLAGGLAHDFNNLLTAIVGNLSLAERMAEDRPQLKEVLAQAGRAGLQASNLTHQLLTFSKGGAPIKRAVSLGARIEESARFCLRGTAVDPRFEIAEDLPCVLCDADQIGQLVHNLVLNATQAMPTGGTVTISARNEIKGDDSPAPPGPGQYVVFRVADQGVGIPPEHLERVFDPYYSTKSAGSGLGLTSAHSIVRKHDGHIEVDSVMGEGTTVAVSLPVVEADEELDGGLAPMVDVKLCGRVLVMDDQPQVRQAVEHMLNHLGLSVDAVEHGQAAVDAYAAALEQGRPYDLVILDLTVPGGMGGAEALTCLRAVDPRVRAVGSSGYSDDPILADHAKHGFVGVIPKPYTVAMVSAVLQDLLPSA